MTLKPLSSLPHLGKAIPFVDGLAMTTGKAIFGIDASLPGMKIAVVARPPVFGGKVATVESADAEKVPGVERVVRLPPSGIPAGFKPARRRRRGRAKHLRGDSRPQRAEDYVGRRRQRVIRLDRLSRET